MQSIALSCSRILYHCPSGNLKRDLTISNDFNPDLLRIARTNAERPCCLRRTAKANPVLQDKGRRRNPSSTLIRLDPGERHVKGQIRAEKDITEQIM